MSEKVNYGILKDYDDNKFIPIGHSKLIYDENGNTVEDRLIALEDEMDDIQAQDGFKNVKVGEATVVADQAEDTLELAGDKGIILTADITNDKVTISHSNQVTAKTSYSQNSDASVSGNSFTVTEVKYDTEGHITGKQEKTITLPSDISGNAATATRLETPVNITITDSNGNNGNTTSLIGNTDITLDLPDTITANIEGKDGEYFFIDKESNVIAKISESGIEATNVTSSKTSLNDLKDAFDDFANDVITEVVAGTGLTGGGSNGSVTLNVGAGNGITVSDNVVSHSDTSTLSGAQAAGTGKAITSVTVDTFGHVTATGSGNVVTGITAGDGLTGSATSGAIELDVNVDRGLSIVNDKVGHSYTADTDTTSTATPGYGKTFTVVDSVTKDTYGHVTKVNTKTVTMPGEQTVNNATITIAAGKGLTTGGDFTTNQSSNETITLNVGAGAGISVQDDTVTNAGVRSVAEGTKRGTIAVNTNGTTADVAVNGLGFEDDGSYHFIDTNDETIVKIDDSGITTSGDVVTTKTSLNALKETFDEFADTVITGVTAGNGLTGGGSAGDVTLNIGAGAGITVTADTISHADTSSATSVVAANGKAINSLTIDGFGHVTAANTSNVINSITTIGDGNAITAASNTNGAVTLTKGATFKTQQTAVKDPTASGNATAFIDSISQDVNGVITVTKKNITTSDLGGINTVTATGTAPLTLKAEKTGTSVAITGSVASAGTNLGTVKSGGDVTIDNGTITVNDDSHNHIIENIDGLQNALDSKQPNLTGAATTIASSNLATNRVVVSNASGKIVASDITTTELNQLDGVTGNIQDQLKQKYYDVKPGSTEGSIDLISEAGHEEVTVTGLGHTGDGKYYFVDEKNNVNTFIDGTGIHSTEFRIPKGATDGGDITLSGLYTDTEAVQDQLNNTKWALSTSVGGPAVSANKLNTNAGSSTNPVYFENGIPKATGNSLAKDITGNAASANKVNAALTVGTKTFDGSTAVEIKPADLGLAQAMKFLGTSKTEITDGATTNPITIGSTNTTVTSGNVVLYGTKEFVWTGSKWEELGNEGSYKVKQTAVASPSASGNASAFIDTIKQDENGNITATKKNVQIAIDATATDDDIVVLTATDGTNAVTYDAKHAQKGPSSGYTSGNTTTSISGSGGSGTIKIPQLTVDKYGHVTAAADESVTITMPSSVTGNAGTADKWKTARNISIADSSKTNTGTAVSVDGSENETLLLPATIKATLTGNADTATKLKTARKINGTDFDGSTDITTAKWGIARNISITDNAGHTGNVTSIDGSGNVSLDLPDTIVANIESPNEEYIFIDNENNGVVKISKDGIETTDIKTSKTSLNALKDAFDTIYTTPVSTTKAGVVPVADTALGTIDNQTNDWVLTKNDNGTVDWYKLPANAFKDTTYEVANTSAAGLAQKLCDDSTKYYRGDGAWAVPPDTKYSAGNGLTLTGTTFEITTADASEIINKLSEGTSEAKLDDYLVAQFAGGGETTTTYHRRKVSNVVNATVVKNALGTGTGTTKYLREDGTWQTPVDTKVTQKAITTNKEYPIILANSEENTEETDTVNKTGSLKYNPSTKVLTAGNLNLTDQSEFKFIDKDGNVGATINKDGIITSGDVSAGNTSLKGLKTSFDALASTKNTKTTSGLVPAPGAVANKVWKTDANGNPGWRDDTDTTYSAATQSVAGLMTAADKKKLDGVATGAEVNQNAFSNVKVGSTTIAADAKTDTLELVASTNVTITPDATNDKVTISALDEKVKNEKATTTKAYITGTTSSSANTGTQVFDTGVYLTETEGQLYVDTLQVGTKILPNTANEADIGTAELPWDSIYVNWLSIQDGINTTSYGKFNIAVPGTEKVGGIGRLILGNDTNSGVAGNAQGQIQMYGKESGYTILNPSHNSTGSVTLTLPDNTGILATIENIAAGKGLVKTTGLYDITLDIGVGAGLIANADDITLQSATAQQFGGVKLDDSAYILRPESAPDASQSIAATPKAVAAAVSAAEGMVSVVSTDTNNRIHSILPGTAYGSIKYAKYTGTDNAEVWTDDVFVQGIGDSGDGNFYFVDNENNSNTYNTNDGMHSIDFTIDKVCSLSGINTSVESIKKEYLSGVQIGTLSNGLSLTATPNAAAHSVTLTGTVNQANSSTAGTVVLDDSSYYLNPNGAPGASTGTAASPKAVAQLAAATTGMVEGVYAHIANAKISGGTGISTTGTDLFSGDGITINLDVAKSTELGGIKIGYTTSGKNYAVGLDANQKAYVNVPWTDTKVTQTVRTTDGQFPILLRGPSAGTTSITDTASFTSSVLVNPSSGIITANGIEFKPLSKEGHGGRIDFHFNESTDYTSRITENTSGIITVQGGLNITGQTNFNNTIIISESSYGTSLPETGTPGQIFFLLVE